MAAEGAPSRLLVEVAHARPEKQVLLSVEVRAGATVTEAIELSGILDHFPDLNIKAGLVGIFSRKVELEQVLRQGDRVEIYRPLIADPKEIRRERAKKNRG